MPNWCDNTLYLSHPDPAMMKKAVDAWNQREFLSVMCPEPDYETTPVFPTYPEIVGSNDPVVPKQAWWDWRVQNWGTKWDIGYDTARDNEAVLTNGQMVVSFDSAWSPPTGAYDTLVDQGYSVIGYYCEYGCDFCGKYDEGSDECYKISEGNLPHDIDDEFNITETMAEWNS